MHRSDVKCDGAQCGIDRALTCLDDDVGDGEAIARLLDKEPMRLVSDEHRGPRRRVCSDVNHERCLTRCPVACFRLACAFLVSYELRG